MPFPFFLQWLAPRFAHSSPFSPCCRPIGCAVWNSCCVNDVASAGGIMAHRRVPVSRPAQQCQDWSSKSEAAQRFLPRALQELKLRLPSSHSSSSLEGPRGLMQVQHGISSLSCKRSLRPGDDPASVKPLRARRSQICLKVSQHVIVKLRKSRKLRWHPFSSTASQICSCEATPKSYSGCVWKWSSSPSFPKPSRHKVKPPLLNCSGITGGVALAKRRDHRK